MKHKELSDFIIEEVNRNLQAICYAGNDNYDRFAASRVKVLVDLLGILQKCKSMSDFRDRINMLSKTALGATTILDEIDRRAAKEKN